LDNLTWGKTKLSAILTYNGYTQQFDNQQYSLTYDLHCWEAVFTLQEQQTGFQPGRTMTFMLRLKALPFSSNFGAGSRGQPLGTGTGTSF
jgi:LPS-assembly protein